MKLVKLARVLVAGLVLGACGGSSGPLDPTEVTFAPELGINLSQMTKTATGLYLQDVTVGTGSPVTAGDFVTVLYRGWLPNGTLFDSKEDPDDPLETRVGLGTVIAGWDEGLLDMRVGGVRKLVIKPSLGYGDRQVCTIPANSTLVFELTLLSRR